MESQISAAKVTCDCTQPGKIHSEPASKISCSRGSRMGFGADAGDQKIVAGQFIAIWYCLSAFNVLPMPLNVLRIHNFSLPLRSRKETTRIDRDSDEFCIPAI